MARLRHALSELAQDVAVFVGLALLIVAVPAIGMAAGLLLAWLTGGNIVF